MAKLNIAERRLPQDGRIKIKSLGREIDLRVSTLPTLYGESVVMRLLDRSAGNFYDLQRLGFDDFMLRRMEHYTSLPHGIFLVTGPTGSGNRPRCIRRSSGSTRPTRRSSPSKIRSSIRWTGSTRST